MKYLLINVVCGAGSTGRICTELADKLYDEGHTVKIAYGRGKVKQEHKKYAVKIGNGLSVKLDALLSRLFDNAGFNSKCVTKRFIKWVKKYDPDVIHLHNIHGYYINVKILFDYLKKSGKKVIWTLHDCWAFTGHCTHFDFINCEKWKEVCGNCKQKGLYPKSYLRDNSKSNYLRKKKAFTGAPNLDIITPSNWLKGKVEQSFLKEYKVTVINNGIDLEVFKPTKKDFKEKYNLQGKKIVLGVANVWGKRKGLGDFIKLSKILPEEYKIVIVGLNDKRLKLLPENILAIKRTDSLEKLVEIYSSAHVFFNPTYEDNYPTVNLEAQACGIPVITYKTGGSVESVPEENVLEKGDYKGLIEKLKENLPVLEIKKGKKEFCSDYLNFYNKV